MNFLYALLIAALFSPLAFSVEETTFEGLFYKSSGQYYFKDFSSQEILKLSPKDRFVRQDLARLDSGDALMGSGYIDRSQEVLFFSAVHFVGLAKMLGIWRSDSNTLFEFVDFNKFNIYEPKNEVAVTSNRPSRYLPIKSYQYSVAPNAQEKWSILINDDTSINAGRLEVTNSTLAIDLIDPNTGEVERTLILRRAF